MYKPFVTAMACLWMLTVNGKVQCIMCGGEFSSPDVQDSPFSVIAWKILSPFNRYPGLPVLGWPVCHVIERKLLSKARDVS